ncbi:MAG: protein kinase [Polyangiaceae bacterium]|nr:protein kinase [Polyangiaceae bacterium]
MASSVWYCPLCQSEGTDGSVVFCGNDGARVRPIAERGAEWIGQVLDGKYRVVRFIDAGGTAEVFEAERLGSGKRVALKLLHAALAATSGALERFLQEAQLVSLIAHPNVVAIQDFGTLPDSVHYMVMELLDGHALSVELADGPPPVLTALRYVMQACEGLAAAHEREVIHCDVKPANLFLQREPGGERTVKILDLGIGRLFAGSAGRGLAETGIIAGTPDYMSPEQATGLELGPATDIYAMGVVLYEMLLGVRPFQDPSYLNVLAKHVNEAPVWHADIAGARGVPPEAADVVLKALAKTPAERQASMLDLQREVASLARLVRGRTSALPLGEQRTLPSLEAAQHGSAPATRPPASRGTPRVIPAAEKTPTPLSKGSRFRRVPLAEATGDDHEIAELAPDVFWVGRRNDAQLECNAYLRVFRRRGTEVSVLIDPGPPKDFDVVAAKVAAILGSLRRLDCVFLNHQDPDVASNAAAIQQSSPRTRVICSEDTWRLAHFYGLDPQRYTAVESFAGGTMALASGHELRFVPTPFCHFRGAVMLYDAESRVLFSGDLFGGAQSRALVATSDSWPGVEMFHQIYMPSVRALALAVARVRRLEPAPLMIAPQHGSVIVGADVEPVLDALSGLQVGLDLLEPGGEDLRFVAAANEMLREFSELAGPDGARELLASYGNDGSFTSLFVLEGPAQIAAFKVAPRLALDALANDALASLPAGLRGDLQRSIRAILRQQGLEKSGPPIGRPPSGPPRSDGRR